MKDKPNVLYILTDQHTPFITGCYGDSVVRTPNLDKLSAQGVTFDNAYTPSPICVPARMSLLTGCYPHRQACWTNSDVLASDRPTFAHAVGAAGYTATLVGRLHAIGPDQLHGFTTRQVGDHSSNWPGGAAHSLGVLTGTSGPKRVSLQKSGAGQSSYQRHDQDVVEATMSLAGKIADDISSGKADPFFVHVGLMLPHQPYVADPELFHYYFNKISKPGIPPPDAERLHPYIRSWMQLTGISEVTDEETQRARAAYYALTETVDKMIGKILDSFETKGLLENTMVVYASDHGDQIGERGLWWKQTLYEQSVRVPLIMSWPGVIPDNQRRSQIVNLVDLAPTFAQVTNAPALTDIDGCSLLNIAILNDKTEADETFSEYCTDGMSKAMAEVVQTRMIRKGPWKLIYYHGYATQLFNLDEDPNELNDLSDDRSFATIHQTLIDRLLEGWCPREIHQQMTRRCQRKNILAAWAQNVNPADTYRWAINIDDNWLE